MQLEQINLSLDPLAYTFVVKKHRKGVEALTSLIRQEHEVSGSGVPVVPREIVQRNEAQAAINWLVHSIFQLNGATKILLQERRSEVNAELAKFTGLGIDSQVDDLLAELGEKEEREQRAKVLADKVKAKDSIEDIEEDKFDCKDLGAALKNLTPAERKVRDESYKRMAEKRRAFIQAALITPHISSMGFGGLLMAGPQVYVPYVTAHGLGLRNHYDTDVRMGTLSLLEAEILATLIHHTKEKEIAISSSVPETLIPYDIQESIATMTAILGALMHKYSGINDREPEVRTKAQEVENRVYEVWGIVDKDAKAAKEAKTQIVIS